MFHRRATKRDCRCGHHEGDSGHNPEEPVTVADVKSPVNAAGANSAAEKIAVDNIRKKLKNLSFGDR